VFEDNNGALLLTTKQLITNQTKNFLAKWHFFWSYVQNGDIDVLKSTQLSNGPIILPKDSVAKPLNASASLSKGGNGNKTDLLFLTISGMQFLSLSCG
jgi:hypothetical protein